MREYEAVEVRQLYRFLTEPGSALWPATWGGWGPCPRHMWGAAVVECEFRQPQAIVTLARELLARALQVLTAPGRPRILRLRALRDRRACPVCAGLDGGPPLPDGEPPSVERVNACAGFSALARRSRDIWAPVTCTLCAGGRGPLCRPHLLELPGGFTRAAIARLGDVHGRLGELAATTVPAGASTPASEAALVEALGFVAGWTDAPVEVTSAW